MYSLDWIERIKARRSERRPTSGRSAVSPTVWRLGFTSLLTDISAEMVNSLLPVYLVLHLHMSPLQYGAIDGIYNGIAVAILGLAGGLLADRTRRHKEVALFGYGISAVCKLLLLTAGAAWGWIAAIIALDRTGKGARTAPRDALISLSTPTESLASAFSVHRALDAGGALLGPVIAFALLTWLPGKFEAIWVTSFAFAILGLAVLWLFVQNPPAAANPKSPAFSWRGISTTALGGSFWKFAAVGSLLSVMTVSDGFLYLILQQRSGLAIGFFPLFYVITACCYMVLSIPIGRVADRCGRAPVLLSGYGVMVLIYVLLLLTSGASLGASMIFLLLLGLYYAATEGVLVAMASSVIPAEYRTSGLALLATLVSGGKLCSSLLFGWLWQSWGTQAAVSTLAIGLLAALLMSAYCLRECRHAKPA